MVKYNILKVANLLSFGVGFLVLGIFLYINDTAKYAEVIFQETSEWSFSPISEILGVSTNTNRTIIPGEECPVGYNLLTFSFYGTNDICVKNSGAYSVRKCRRISNGETLLGMAPVILRRFND
jgi:hypothetical protein